jgi:hypothetical protein
MVHLASELRGKGVGRLADEIGAGDVGEEGLKPRKAPRLRPAPRDPINVGEACECLAGGVGIGGLGVVDEQHGAAPRHLLHAVGKAGEGLQALGDGSGVEPLRPGQRVSRRRVLPIMGAAKRADAGEADPRPLHPILDLDECGVLGPHPGCDLLAGGDALDLERPLQPVGDRAADGVVDADHRGAAFFHPRKHPRLDGGIGLKRAVAVEMVGGDVEKAGGVGRKLRREIDLEGGQLEHIDEIRGKRLKIKHRLADIAAERHTLARFAEQMGGERRRGRFAIGASDHHDPAGRAFLCMLAKEELGVADDLHTSLPRAGHGPMRVWMRQGNAGREHERGEARPVDGVKIARRQALGGRSVSRFCRVVPGKDLRAARGKPARGSDAA